jgi:hypothetical protein
MGDEDRMISYGLKGSADILGIIKPSGKFLAVEIKSGQASQTAQQKAFEKMITDFGGVYILARSADDALRALHCYKTV